MKYTHKLSIIYALFFTLICTGIHAQKFDIDEFHIPEGLNLSDSEYKRLSNTGKQLREKLVADLQAQGYDIISPRRSKIRLERVGIGDIKIDYDPEADRVIFGKLLTDRNYITINAYLYGSENGIRTAHEPLMTTTINRQSHQLNDPEEINTAVSEIIAGLSLNKPKPAPEPITTPTPDPIPAPPPAPTPDPVPVAPTPKPAKVCSKVPGTALIVAGGLMGGTGIYLRIKAKNIYDNDYVPEFTKPNFDEQGARDILDDARRPNRMAHIIGAGGILTAGIGTYLWMKCSKKQKKANGMSNIQITPLLEYNAVTNTNNVTARISFNF